METREELGIGGLSIGRPIEEGPDGFDRFEHAVNSLFARIDGKTKEILPWMRGTLADAREGFLSESRAVPELAAIALNGTIVQMSAREAEAITRMPARQSTGEPAPHEPQDPKKPNPFDRAEAVLQRGAEALKRGTQNIWENAKQSVGQAYDTTRRSLGKNTTGSLIEIDTTADLLPQIQPSHKRSASILALPPGGRGEYALVGRNGDGNPYVQIVSPSDTRPKITPRAKTSDWSPENSVALPVAGVPAKVLPQGIFRTPAPEAVPSPEPPQAIRPEMVHIADFKGADYGTMPKLAGEAALEAWASGILRFREGSSHTEDQSALLDSFLEQTAKWGWNDAAATAAFDMISDILYPTVQPPTGLKETDKTPVTQEPPVRPVSIIPTGTFRAPVPVDDDEAARQRRAEEDQLREEARLAALTTGGQGGGDGGSRPVDSHEQKPNGWRKFLAGFVAGSLATAVLFGVTKCVGESMTVESQSTPTPSVSKSPAPSTQPSGDQAENNGEDSDTPDNSEDDSGQEGKKPVIQTGLKGAEADKKGDFVRMTAYSDRHESREDGNDFSTVWWIAEGQLDAVNGAATPTVSEVQEFTAQTLKHNKLTWQEAHDLRKGHVIRLLSDAAAKQVIKTVK